MTTIYKKLKTATIIALISSSWLLSSCAAKPNQIATISTHSELPKRVMIEKPAIQKTSGYSQVGMASWYGKECHGKATALGPIYNKRALTAAHPTLPLPSQVKVTNLSNGKTVILTVHDRGPFSKNRIIDVSEKAAEVLGMKREGVAKVKVELLVTTKPVQISALTFARKTPRV